MNQICNICNINKVLKDRTVCKSCYNKNRKNNVIKDGIDITPQQPKLDNIINKNGSAIVSELENHAFIVIGPRNVGKTYYKLKKLEKIGKKRSIHTITRSPNQYSNYKTINEIKPIDKYKVSVVIFDDMLGAQTKTVLKSTIFTRGVGTKELPYFI